MFMLLEKDVGIGEREHPSGQDIDLDICYWFEVMKVSTDCSRFQVCRRHDDDFGTEIRTNKLWAPWSCLHFFDVLDPIELNPTSSTCELRKKLRIDSDETSDRKEEPRSDGHPNFFIMVCKVYRTDGTDQKDVD